MEGQGDIKNMGFLGVVIGLDSIKMEKKKVKEVLDWPAPKEIKNV